jgi:hypothetical protein
MYIPEESRFAFVTMMKWSVIEGKPKEVKGKGKIYAIFDDIDVTSSPAVTFYPRKGSVYYLKFNTKEDLERQAFTVDETVIIEGTLRCVDGKQTVTNVKRSTEEL